MSQRVPNCHSDDVPAAVKAADIPMLDYEVAELTWENGQLGMNGLGPPRVPAAPSKYSSTGAGGTLESIVDQATRFPKPTSDAEVVPWFQQRSSSRGMDALVPDQHSQPTTRIGSCSDGYPQMGGGGKRARDGSERVTTIDTYGLTSTTSMDDNSSSGGGKPNCTKTTTATTTTFFDDHEYSVSHSRPQMEELEEEEEEGGKTSVSTKRSRTAAIHNQSERKRRDKINQRMKTLQKLVPNSSKTDKASMLDEVIEYLKQLQAQIGMMSIMNMPSMMLPAMAMQQQQQQQQQFQLSLMSNPMGLGLSMGMPGLGLLDLNSMNRAAVAVAATTPNIHANMMPNPFVPMTSPTWDASATSNDTRFQSPHLVPDPMAAFLACSSQPTTMEAYSRMAALYQQMQQQLPPSNHK
ncbi:unnamed protein product [Cochlearia groenlandica]